MRVRQVRSRRARGGIAARPDSSVRERPRGRRGGKDPDKYIDTPSYAYSTAPGQGVSSGMGVARICFMSLLPFEGVVFCPLSEGWVSPPPTIYLGIGRFEEPPGMHRLGGS